MRTWTRGIALPVAALVVAAGGLAVGPETAVGKGFKGCGEADIGYTDARVKSRHVGCATARRVVRHFVDKYPGPQSGDCVLETCRVKRRFFCTLGGSPGIAKLRCSNPSGRNRDLKATWGD